MLSIKICGITRVVDAQAAVEAGADAIGLNFYPGSKRFVSAESAMGIVKTIVQSVDKVVQIVGVFVNASASEVNQIAEKVGLEWVQLHGDEPPEYLGEISPHLKILRVYRPSTENLALVTSDLARCKTVARLPDAILIDTAAPGEYGGTGKKGFEIELNRGNDIYLDPFMSLHVMLAGGLTPENVAEAIRASRPHGVDVASGVEVAPGIKDPEKIRRFVYEARESLASLRE